MWLTYALIFIGFWAIVVFLFFLFIAIIINGIQIVKSNTSMWSRIIGIFTIFVGICLISSEGFGLYKFYIWRGDKPPSADILLPGYGMLSNPEYNLLTASNGISIFCSSYYYKKLLVDLKKNNIKCACSEYKSNFEYRELRSNFDNDLIYLCYIAHDPKFPSRARLNSIHWLKKWNFAYKSPDLKDEEIER